MRTARRLLENPQDIDIAGSVWKSHEVQSEGENAPEQSFYKRVKDEISQEAKGHWKEITSEKLIQLLRTYTNSRLVRDMAESIFMGYFRGPTGVKQRVDSMYKFVYGLIDVATDR